MPKYINADKLNKKKQYSFQTQFGCFPKSEWFIKAEDFFAAPAEDVAPVVHARWVLRQSNGYAVCNHCCHGDHVDPLATHCRYCGAKMDQE